METEEERQRRIIFNQVTQKKRLLIKEKLSSPLAIIAKDNKTLNSKRRSLDAIESRKKLGSEK